jgi:metal-sulfur cluster biosynthetic enzyme
MNAPSQRAGDARLQEVWDRLATVSDPELDESVADMGFIESVALGQGGSVSIAFRLPTFWCAPNFAYIMARDMREAVETLDWVTRAEIELRDHCNAEEINRGVADGLSFADTFPGQVAEELENLRATFRRKAYQGRQEKLLRRLLAEKFTPTQLATLSLHRLAVLDIAGGEFARMRERYLEIRGEFGGPAAESDLAFTTPEGKALDSESFTDYLKDLRRVRMNAQFNANMCKSLLDTRYGEGGK